MDAFQNRVKEVFDNMKRQRKEDLLTLIPLYHHDDLYGFLRPITKDYRITIPDCGSLLAKWRNENPTMSAQAFLATAEGTERWLDNQVIEREDRILFLVLGLDGAKIGHIGFSSFNFEDKSCEVDAVLRGDKSAAPGMMSFALAGLIDWGLRELKLKKITLRVFDDNHHAIRFYQRNHFILMNQEKNHEPVHHESEKQYASMYLDIQGWKAAQWI
ncbi:GNAT family N-acetyltransferase [Sinanaerobacter chloroacetimidivorans]|uniref:GNAT family N-acetyltransferase n=1 Tax=Sinanaerobacter chloroacetimidivorans TaxID=2818044 RepID=A0A8J7W0R4_9FIRM|nr:GNAT family N-acetyltransferase [Sinanaerobacter chloroacetimidivorans]MBR0598679.1 GNAT family N-acetyltransferase [Sinanaerobacter chloroacetimidivorans]